MENRTIWQQMLMIDRRILYLILFVNMILFLLLPVKVPTVTSPPVRKFYDTVEQLQPGDMVMVSSNWSAGTIGENLPQLEAVIRHLMRKRARFTIISVEPQSRDISLRFARRFTKEGGYKYGEDWAHFGFVPNLVVAIKGMVKDLPATIKQDVDGKPIDKLPVMRGIKTLADYKMVIDITPAGTVAAWISYRPKDLIVLFCPTSVMAAEAYTFLDSGQVAGMLTGAIGAQEYEQLLQVEGLGTPFAKAISFSHALIILFIILGNIALFMSRRTRGG
ncbi:MAG: hypothetical protein ABDI19_07120 [Armatimonadota bacterium]